MLLNQFKLKKHRQDQCEIALLEQGIDPLAPPTQEEEEPSKPLDDEATPL
jgi:hypothetical protein